MPLNATQKVGYLRAVHRLNLCFLHARQFAHVRRIHLYQPDFNGLLQRPVKRAMRIVNRFRGKLAQAVYAAIERIIQVLNLAGRQVTEFDFPQIRNKAIADGRTVFLDCARLYVQQIVIEPCIQPFLHRQARGRGIRPLVNVHGDLLEALPDFLLCRAVDGTLDLFARTGVTPDGISRFPSSIRALSDCSAALRIARRFSGHGYSLSLDSFLYLVNMLFAVSKPISTRLELSFSGA